MNIVSIATLIYIGLLLIFGVISAALIYHLRRYYLRNDRTQEMMGITYFVVAGILITIATYFFLSVDWSLINVSYII